MLGKELGDLHWSYMYIRIRFLIGHWMLCIVLLYETTLDRIERQQKTKHSLVWRKKNFIFKAARSLGKVGKAELYANYMQKKGPFSMD